MAADLIVINFDTPKGAQQAVAAVSALEELRYAWIDDVAVVERTHGGHTRVHTTHGSVTGAAFWGGLAGMFIGLLWPPLFFLGFWGAGLGIGALIGKATKEAGLDQDMLREVKESVQPGTSALVLIGATGDADQMARAFEPYHPSKVQRHRLSDETIEHLSKVMEEAPGQDEVDEAHGQA